MFKRKKSEVEFRGVSASSDKKNAVILFVVEALVVILFIAGVLFVLNYVGIFPLNTISEKLFGGLPSNPINKLEVVSDIPGYKIEIKNKSTLIDLFSSWGVYDREYEAIYSSEGSTNGVPVSEIVIHLTDVIQNANHFATSPEEIYASGFTKISEGRLDVFIHLEKTILESTDNQIIPENVMGQVVMSTVYSLAKYGKTGEETQRNRNIFFESFKTDSRMQEDFFEINKL